METSLFEITENGEIIYEDIDEQITEEGEGADNGESVVENVGEGDILPGALEDEEVLETTQETVLLNLSDGDAVPVVLSDEVTTAIIDSMTPAGGALSSSTLDYFDRVVSSLPSDYKYVAYRTSTDNSSDGVLYYGDDYEIDDNCISFGEDACQLRVQRVSQSGYNNVTEYNCYSAVDVDVYYSQAGDTVYYTNAEVGYPVLGSVVQPVGYGFCLTVGLVCSFAVVVLQRLLLKR